MKLEVDVTFEEFRALSILTEDGSPAAALKKVAEVAAEGVRKVGNWERDAIIHIFSDDWEKKVEADPGNRGQRRVSATALPQLLEVER